MIYLKGKFIKMMHTYQSLNLPTYVLKLEKLWYALSDARLNNLLIQYEM